MNDEKVAQIIDAPTEPKTSAEWQQKVSDCDVALAGTLEPPIRSAIEKLRAHGVQMKFLAEVTAPTVNVADAPAQQFATPRVPETMPVSVVESIKMWDGKIEDIERSLRASPPPHFIPAYRELLDEAKKKREKVIFDFHNPAPIPVPPPPPPIALPPEVVELVREILRDEVPSIIAQTIAWFRANPEWMRS